MIKIYVHRLITYIDLNYVYQYYDIKKLMSIFDKKEKNLNQLINKLDVLSSTYSHSSYEVEKIKTEKNEILRQKTEIEKKNHELTREHKYLKNKIAKLQEEVNKNSILEDKFNQDIEEISQETENLVSEIEKWQT